MNKLKYAGMLIALLVMMSFGHSTEVEKEPEMWEKGLTSEERQELENIGNSFGTQQEQLKAIAEKLPHIAQRIIDENKHELDRFEGYCVGIPADEGMSLEDTLYLDERNLRTEVYLLENYLKEKK